MRKTVAERRPIEVFLGWGVREGCKRSGWSVGKRSSWMWGWRPTAKDVAQLKKERQVSLDITLHYTLHYTIHYTTPVCVKCGVMWYGVGV